MANNTVTRQLSIFINDREVRNSLSGIGREMSSVNNQLRNLNAGSDTFDEDMLRLQGELETLREHQAAWREELYGTTQALEASANSMAGVEKRMQEITAELQLLDSGSEGYNERLATLGSEYKTLHQKQTQYKADIASATTLQTQHTNSLAGVEAQMSDVRSQMSNLDRDSADYREELSRLQGEYSGLQERQQEFREEIGLTNDEMGAAQGAFSQIFDGLKTGNLEMVKEGFSGLKSGILETAKAGKAFISTGIGATIVALVAAFAAAKYIFDFNQRLAQMNDQLSALGVNAEELAKVRNEIEATAETYGKEFDEIAQKAASLAKSYGISMTEANDIIAKGLADGGAKSDEYLDSIGEYSVFFAKAGYSAKEFIDLLNTGYELQIFSDKLPDALKEADLALKEQTQSTRDALVNAFGANFSNDILSRIKTGEVATKEALEEIAAKSKEVSLSQQQEAQLTADVFKGAGEDAGGALKILEAIGKAANREMSDSAKATDGLRKANEALNTELADLLEIEGFGNIWTGIKTIAVEALSGILRSFNQVKNFIVGGVRVIYNLLTGDVVGAFNIIKNALGNIPAHIGNLFIGLYNIVIDGVKKLVGAISPVLDAVGVDVDKLQKKLNSFKGSKFEIKAEVKVEVDSKDIVKSGEDLAAKMRSQVEKQINQLTRRKNRMEALGKDTFKIQEQILTEQLKLYAKDSAEYENTTNQLLKLRTDHNKKVADENKKAADERKKAHDIWAKADQEITALIAKSQNDRALGQLTGLQKEIAQIEAKWQTEREKYSEHLDRLAEIDNEKEAELQAAKAAKAKEYGLQIDQINAELERDREVLRLDKLAAEATTEEEKQAALLEKAQFLADWELQTEMDKELAKVEEVENAEQLKQAIRDKYALKKAQNDQKFAEAEKAVKSDIVNWTKLTEEQKLQLTKNALNGAAEAFNKGSGAWKAIKIAETSITTYQAAMNAYNSLAGIPVVGPALGVAAAAAATVSGLKQVQNISKTKIEKAPKFFRGGRTGDKILFPDEYGGVTGVVHKNEWVAPEYMTKDPRYANVITWLENERVRNNGYASGGTVTAPGATAAALAGVPDESVMDRLLSAITTLNGLLQAGIKAETNIGYKQVKDMDSLRNDIEQSNRNGTLNS